MFLRFMTRMVLFLVLAGIPLALYPQNTVSLSVGSVDMEFVTPASAGNPVVQVGDNSKWLNYNSTRTPPLTTYSITVQLESALPDGISIQVTAGTYQGNWGGSADAPNQRGAVYSDNPAGQFPGIPASPVTLSLTPQVILSNIGSFNTGTGVYLGHQLTYTMNIADYSTVRAVSLQVNVLFTLNQFE